MFSKELKRTMAHYRVINDARSALELEENRHVDLLHGFFRSQL